MRWIRRYGPICAEVAAVTAALLPWLVMIGAILPHLTFGSADLRLLKAMQLGGDETYVAEGMRQFWRSGMPPSIHPYGTLYLNIGWIVLFVVRLFTPITEQVVIVVLRSISLACFLSVGIVSYFWLKRRIGLVGGLAYSLLFLLLSRNNDFLQRAFLCQVDTLNLLCSLLAFLAGVELLERLEPKWLYIASMAAGFAMAVKHSGFLFLPLLGLILLIHALRGAKEKLECFTKSTERILSALYVSLGIGFVALLGAAAVLLTKGSAWIRWLPIPNGSSVPMVLLAYASAIALSFGLVKLIRTFRVRAGEATIRVQFWYESMLVVGIVFVYTFGVASVRSWLGLEFFSVSIRYAHAVGGIRGWAHLWAPFWWRFVSGEIMGLLPTALMYGGISIVILRLVRNWKEYYSNCASLALIWIVAIFIIVLLPVGRIQDRYLFPMYPAILFLSVIPILEVNSRFRNSRLKIASVACVVTVLLVITFSVIDGQVHKIRENFSCLECKSGVQVGRWLDANYDSDTRILGDMRAFIPSRFQPVDLHDYGDLYSQFVKLQPDVVLINMTFVNHLFRLRDDDFDDVHMIRAGVAKRFYTHLFNGALPYKRIAVFGDKKQEASFADPFTGAGFTVFCLQK